VSDAGFDPPPPPPDLAPPPGYVGYTSGRDSARTIVTLRNVILLSLVVLAIITAIQLARTPDLIDTSRDLIAGRITVDQYEDDVAPGALSIAGQIPSIACIVLSVIWLYRQIRAHVAAGRRGTWGPGWAIGGWFLPPLVLYIIPLLVLRETWKAADADVPIGDDAWKTSRVHPILWVWWVLYGLAPAVLAVLSFAGGLSVQVGGVGNESTVEAARDFVDHAALTYAQSVVTLLGAAAWAAVVYLWTARYVEFAQRLPAPTA